MASQSRGSLPSDIANLGLWLKADAGVTLVSGAVDAWADQSGNARDFTAPAAGNRPAYSGTLNGLPVLTFDGTTDYLNGNAQALTLCNALTGITIIAVVDYGATAIQRVIGISATSSSSAGRVSMGTSATEYDLGARRLDADSFTTISGGSPVLVPVIQSSTVRFSLGTGMIRVNGASVVDTSLTTAGTSQAGDSLRAVIGVGTVLSGFLNGSLAEVIVYQRALSTAERASVERYLSVKWGISI